MKILFMHGFTVDSFERKNVKKIVGCFLRRKEGQTFQIYLKIELDYLKTEAVYLKTESVNLFKIESIMLS